MTRSDPAAATFHPAASQGLAPIRPIAERLAVIHGRIAQLDPSIDRIAFVRHDPTTGRLNTYLSHDCLPGRGRFADRPLTSLPGLQQMGERQLARVIDDLAALADPPGSHTAWLLAQGWRSSFGTPLHDGDGLLGFLFLNASRPGAFQQRRLAVLQPHIDLAAALVRQDLTELSSLNAMVRLAIQMVSQRDPETGDHLRRVSQYSRLISEGLAQDLQLSGTFLEHMSLFAGLHDVGKVAVSDAILYKPGGLDDAERLAMKQHVVDGEALIEEIIHGLRLEHHPHNAMLRHMVRSHHERLDGSGYPDGLRGDAIRLEARIVAVADIYDALISHRRYRADFNLETVEALIQEMADQGRIDSRCVTVLLAAREERLAIASASIANAQAAA